MIILLSSPGRNPWRAIVSIIPTERTLSLHVRIAGSELIKDQNSENNQSSPVVKNYQRTAKKETTDRRPSDFIFGSEESLARWLHDKIKLVQ